MSTQPLPVSDIGEIAARLDAIKAEINSVFIGRPEVVDLAMTAVLHQGIC